MVHLVFQYSRLLTKCVRLDNYVEVISPSFVSLLDLEPEIQSLTRMAGILKRREIILFCCASRGMQIWSSERLNAEASLNKIRWTGVGQH